MNNQREQRKVDFVKVLAKYLVGDQAMKSIMLEMKKPAAQEWAALRNTTPLFGYLTVEEAEKKLAEWLGIPFPRNGATKGKSA